MKQTTINYKQANIKRK